MTDSLPSTVTLCLGGSASISSVKPSSCINGGVFGRRWRRGWLETEALRETGDGGVAGEWISRHCGRLETEPARVG